MAERSMNKFKANRSKKAHSDNPDEKRQNESMEGKSAAQGDSASKMARMSAGESPHGARAMAGEAEGKPTGEREEQLEEQVAPGIHDEIKQMAAEHGPAHTVHIAHDHEAGRHDVHSMHPDGHEHRATHSSAMHAHHHAMHAAGLNPAEEKDKEGEYPGEGETAHEPDGDDFHSEPL